MRNFREEFKMAFGNLKKKKHMKKIIHDYGM